MSWIILSLSLIIPFSILFADRHIACIKTKNKGEKYKLLQFLEFFFPTISSDRKNKVSTISFAAKLKGCCYRPYSKVWLIKGFLASKYLTLILNAVIRILNILHLWFYHYYCIFDRNSTNVVHLGWAWLLLTFHFTLVFILYKQTVHQKVVLLIFIIFNTN